MKKSGKILTTLFAASLLATSMIGVTGCKKDGDGLKSDDPNAIQISVAQLGYGTGWLTEVGKAFIEDTGIPINLTTLTGQAANQSFRTEINSLSSKTDLFIYQEGGFFEYIYKGAITAGGKSYDNYFADLTDIYKSPYDGENGATMESKMSKNMLDYLQVDGKYYSAPWIDGQMSLLVNMNVWNACGLTEAELPLTTDEMFAVSDRILAAGKVPFIYSLADQYYTSVAPLWFYQYEGKEQMAKFDAGLDPNGEETANLYSYDGQLEAVKVLEKLIQGQDGKYQHEDSKDLSFTDMQGYFMLDGAAFCMNGSWLEIESANYVGANIKFLRLPIISSIINNLPTVNDDATLRAVIQYVDGTSATKPAGVSDEDIERVREARDYSCATTSTAHHMMVSAYSPRVDSAKQFIKYLYSDKGMKIYYNALQGGRLPANLSNGTYDDIELTEFRKSVNAIPFEQVGVCPKKARVYALGGVGVRFENGVGGDPIRALTNGTTAAEIINMNKTYIQNNWSQISMVL